MSNAAETPKVADGFDAIRARYVELTGKVPPSIETRIEVNKQAGRLDAVEAIEEHRQVLIMNNPLGRKFGQLVHFSQLVALGDASPARLHARSAFKAGATVSELVGVAELSLITSGIPAYSLAIEIIGELLEEESGSQAE
ncbi:MAG: carboxymuconolactone decarboxylase family protein [Actinomycetota bacterium]|nr:carboxymuconolactone decarboxylase family protein [Actinomycetota bacterium]